MASSENGLPQDGIDLDGNNSDDDAKSTVSQASSVRSVASVSALHKRAHLAALQQQRTFAEKQQELEAARMQAEFRLKQLELDKQLAVAQAELVVYEQADAEDSDPEVTFPKLARSAQRNVSCESVYR